MTEDILAAGQILNILEKFTREPRELILRLLGPVADATGERWADRINAARTKNMEHVANLVIDRLRERSTQPRPVELSVLVPILQHASLESRQDLVSMWTGLLASAASRGGIHTAYPRILSEITPGEARLLDALYRWETTSADEGDRDLLRHADLSEADLPVAGINLGLRHGLIDGVRTSLWKPDLSRWNNIRLTPLGRDFVMACRGPQD